MSTTEVISRIEIRFIRNEPRLQLKHTRGFESKRLCTKSTQITFRDPLCETFFSRKSAKKSLRNAVALCAFAPLRLCAFAPLRLCARVLLLRGTFRARP